MSKWFTDIKDYPLNKYPYFLRGSAYLLTGDVIPGEQNLDVEKRKQAHDGATFPASFDEISGGGVAGFKSDQILGGITVHASEHQGSFFFQQCHIKSCGAYCRYIVG